MAGVKKDLGPTGRRVAANLKRIRQKRGYGYAQLARRLRTYGQPILDTGLLKAEQGERRIDVDDLVALAAALNCSPAALLMPEANAPIVPLQVETELTPGKSGSLGALWAWATGEQSLEPTTPAAEADFASENRPHRFALASQTGSPVMDDYFKMQALVIEAMRHGTTSWQLRTMFEQSLVAGLNGLSMRGMTLSGEGTVTAGGDA